MRSRRVAAVAITAVRGLAARWPDARVTRAAIWHVADAMPDRMVTFGIPGGARVAATLEYRWRDLFFRGAPAMTGRSFEPEVSNLLATLLRPGDTFVDVGANVGYFSAMAGRIVGPGGHVHAFEPNPHVLPMLQKTIAVNGFADRVTVHPSAVGRSPGAILLFASADPANTGMATTSRTRAYEGFVADAGIEVPMVRLDDALAAHGVTAVRLLKIDVEGVEMDVIAGAGRVLSTIRPAAVVLEFAPENLDDPAASWHSLIEAMASHGYRPNELDVDGSLHPIEAMPAREAGNVCFVPLPGD